jgi:hypothetical protein
MKNILKSLATKTFFAIAISILLISSCKKVEMGTPFTRPVSTVKKNPVPLVISTGTNTIVTTATTHTVITSETPTELSSGTDNYCPSVKYPIWAGAGQNDTTKGIKVGTVSYSNDSVNLYVTTTFPGPTCPTEIHLWAGINHLAVSGNGGLPFGKFPYKLSSAACGSHTFSIPLSSLFPVGTLKQSFCHSNIYIVLHAAMGGSVGTEGNISSGQTAIGYGSQSFGGSRWGWIATYNICCPN